VYPTKPPFTSFLGTADPSAVGGNEGVFEVVSASTSSDASFSYQKGDWVLPASNGFGTWRTHALAQKDQVLKIENKEGITPLQAGTVSVNPCTAYRMLKDFETLDPQRGDWFIQNGANSGVGRAAVQIGKIWGIRSINVIRARESEPETQALKDELISLGATKVVTEEELMAREFREKVKDWTNGGREQIKVGLNCVGGKPTQALVKSLSQSGHLVTYGGMARAPLALSTSSLIFKDNKFSGFWATRWGDGDPQGKRDTIAEILDWIREGKFKDVPVQEMKWDWGTEGETLTSAVQGTLGGFRKGKGIFIFGDT
jgi:trans-2-enoyl-CoA reductase